MCKEMIEVYAEVANEMATNETYCIMDGNGLKAKAYSEIRAALIGQIKDKLNKEAADGNRG